MVEWGPNTLIPETLDAHRAELNTLSLAEYEQAKLLGPAPAAPGALDPPVPAPGWDEIIILGKRRPPTRDEWREHYQSLREHRQSGNPIDVELEIERRIRIRDRIEHSPQPLYYREGGKILTVLDDTQDLLSTIAVGGRFLIKPLAPLHNLLGVPMSIILGGANLIRNLTMLGMLLMPLYAWLCRGPREALAAGMPALLMGRTPKKLITSIGKQSPKAKRWKCKGAPGLCISAGLADRARDFMGARFTKYNLIELVQVTKDLFGFGIVFGGLMGMIGDAAFGFERKSRGEPMRLKTPRNPELYRQMLGTASLPDDRALLEDLHAASVVLSWLPWMLDPQMPLTDDERIEIMAAAYTAYEVVAPYVPARVTSEVVRAVRDDRWSPPAWSRAATIDHMAEGEHRPELARPTWPAPGAPATLDGLAWCTGALDACDRWWDYLDQREEQYSEDLALQVLTTRLFDRAVITLADDEMPGMWTMSDDQALAESLVDQSLYVNTLREPESAERYLAAYVEHRERTGRTLLSRDELLTLAARTGAEVFPLVNVDAAAAR